LVFIGKDGDLQKDPTNSNKTNPSLKAGGKRWARRKKPMVRQNKYEQEVEENKILNTIQPRRKISEGREFPPPPNKETKKEKGNKSWRGGGKDKRAS